ncbi:Dehydrogenase/reductase SDR family member on chromosome X [Thalictrum thalictroides]|uniref:Dehydrogenase/reductase SDR family member on chromosome X n=1 Tax=Thalictrum thalictroides TaxID=46969 RepID=A0A7J6VCR9_THATH|nr:Dehydrogenase/reductase SDR family member on chromosome X [Thalictrum thalictroides]
MDNVGNSVFCLLGAVFENGTVMVTPIDLFLLQVMATSGLGAAAALSLAREGFYVVLAGRCKDLLSKTMVEIKQEDTDAHVKAFQVDLSSFQSMLKFKSSLQQWLLDSDMHPSIQLLINNAGILATSHRYSVEGYDQMMGTNYIGAFVLTNHLLPLLKDSYIPSRVVNVTSFTHRCVSNMQVDEETLFANHSSLPKAYPFAQVYESTKFCLVLFSYELHRRLRLVGGSTQVSVMAADPGAVSTNIMRELPLPLSNLAMTTLKFLGLLQSSEDGVKSILDAALAPPELSGAYFFGGRGRTIASSVLSYDSKLAEKLWNSSCKLFHN